HAEADTLISGALAIWTRSLGADHPRLSAGWFNLALNAESLGDLPRAVEAMGHALALDATALSEDHPFVAQDREELGRLLAADGRTDEGLVQMRRALDAYQADDPDGEDAARLRAMIARVDQEDRP
ncbi:tetratricopeptide repeat protein, partial [bacterium]|nr:tetratricopeptide repeat protein [bacterium]